MTDFKFKRTDEGWETSRKVRGQGTQWIEVSTSAGYSKKMLTWAQEAVEALPALTRKARALVGKEMLQDYYRDELGYGRNRVERVLLNDQGQITGLIFAFASSWATVNVDFDSEGKATDWASTG